MAVLQCARGCARLISISEIPGGNPAALADPEGYALQYLRCSGCGACVCDRCTARPPQLAPPCACPGCGSRMDWAGVSAGASAAGGMPKTQAMDASMLPRGPAAGGAMAASPAAAEPGHRAYGASFGQASAVEATPTPWWTTWRGSRGSRYERTAKPAELQAEIPRMVALYQQRKRIGGFFGWGALAAFLGGLPAMFLTHEFISRHSQAEVGSIFAASFVLMLTLWFLIGTTEMNLHRFTDLQRLLAKLRLDPNQDVKVVLLGPHEGRWLELEGTLSSGIRLKLARIQLKTFVSQSRTGNTIRTTYSISADDDVTLLFDAGRVPVAQVEAAAALLREKLQAPSGGRLTVVGNATTLNLRYPAMVRPSIEDASTSMPKLVGMLHSLVDGRTPAVDDNALPPPADEPVEPINGGVPALMTHPVAIGVAALVLLTGSVGLVLGIGSTAYRQYAELRLSAIYEAERGMDYRYGGYASDSPFDAERRELYDRVQTAEMGTVVCLGPGLCFAAFGPLMLAFGAFGFWRRQQKQQGR